MTGRDNDGYRIFESDPRLTTGNLQIIACAGSGKTEFVSARIAYMVSRGITRPGNIVAFTFTEKAAKELKFRIRSKIRSLIGHRADIGDLYVGTIHSFCFELLKEFVPGYRGFDVLDEGKRYAFISSIGRELDLEALQGWLEANGTKPWGSTRESWAIGTFIRNVDMVREEMKRPEDVSRYPGFVAAYNTYEKILHEKRFLDFSAMMARSVEHLARDKKVLKDVRGRFTHITVDEYQDVNPIQEKLVNLLAGKNGNLCVVGDDDQSIYQWRGATINNILTFREHYDNVSVHHLPVNYRSTDGIINLGNDLISRNRKRLDKSMKSSGKKTENGDIYKIDFYDQNDEVKFVVERIRHLVGTRWADTNGPQRGLAYSDIAVFFRSVRFDSKPYLEAFKEAGIPYAVSGVGGLFDAPEIKVVFSVLSFLADPDSKEGLTPEDVYGDAARQFSIPGGTAFARGLMELKDRLRNARRVSFQEMYADILVLLGINDEARHGPLHEVEMYNLGRFSRVLADYEGTRSYCTYRDIGRFCWFIKHFAEGSYDAGTGEDPTLLINAVRVMTLHGTKGLGFPAVFMPYSIKRPEHGLASGFLDPSKFDLSRYKGGSEDERRLFYVGLTRSKKFLYITTSGKITGKKWHKDPSPYFTELNDRHCMVGPYDDPTKRKMLPSSPAADDYQFPTSYSQLSDYIRCAYDYKMRYIYNFNPVLVQAIGYGRQVHNVLNMLHKQAQDEGKVPAGIDAEKLINEHFFLRYAADRQQEILKNSALRSVLRYLDLWKQDFSLSLKTEHAFEMDVENALIAGSIDLLKRKDEDGSTLEIIDFKTGNERKLEEELMLQVRLYTVAARESLNLNVDKAYVHFLDERKNERVEISTDLSELDNAMQTIRRAVAGVTRRHFDREPRNKKVCGECDWKRLCPSST